MKMRLSIILMISPIFLFSGICKAEPNLIEKLRQKAESGDPNSQLILAKKYFDGKGLIRQDYNEAVKWFRKAAEGGLAEAQNNLGKMYYYGYGVPQDYNEAAKWIKKAATQGHIKAQVNLGLLYYDGQGVAQSNNEAITLFTKVAERGDANAQLCLGLIYYKGEGISENYKVAAEWFAKAAEQGVAKAEFVLGVMYSEGKGVSQNYKIAAKWFTKSATQGVIEAQYLLGMMYDEGIGFQRDYIESYKWYLLAEMNGDKGSKKFKESLRWRMTTQQVEEAQRRANRLKRIKGFYISEITEEFDDNKQITQRIGSSATGFLITSDGFVLTACHAIEESVRIEVLYNKKPYNARVIRKDTSTDVAILKIEDNNLPFLPIVSSSAVRLGDAVFTIGYPRITLQGADPKYTEGSISALSGLDSDSRCFQISVPVQPGNSGGPLVNEKGEVIGIIISKLNDVAILLITGSIPQNVNYALKSSFVLSFMESIPDLSQKISVPISSNSVQDKSTIIEKTEKSIVVIIGYE